MGNSSLCLMLVLHSMVVMHPSRRMVRGMSVQLQLQLCVARRPARLARHRSRSPAPDREKHCKQKQEDDTKKTHGWRVAGGGSQRA